MFYLIAAIIIIYLIYLLVRYVLAPLSGILAIASLVIGVGYALIMAIYHFGKSLVENINPYDTYEDNNRNIPSGVRRSYFFGPGFHQIGIIVKESFEGLTERTGDILDWCKDHTSWWSALFIWLFFIAYCISIYVFGFIIMSVFSIILTAVILTGACIFFVMFTVLWGLDRLTLVINSIQSRCANCKRISVVPVFICPDCGTEHRKLTPGPYGIFSRRCVCGKRLATTFINGRSKLAASCPYCTVELASSSARQYGIQLIGGVSTGKTTFLAAFFHIYLERIGKLHYMSSKKKPVDAFNELEHWYQQGLSSSTTETNANMYSIIHKRRNGTSYQLTIYDIAGEAFSNLRSNNQQQQFKYCEGLIFVVDPTAKPKDVNETFASFIQEFKGLRGRHSAKTSGIPAAVIISKADLYKAETSQPREFLLSHGYENVLNLMEGEFSRVQYYPVSAMGHKAMSGQRYEPWGVTEPVKWLFSHSNAPFYEYLTHKFRFGKWLKNLLFSLIRSLIIMGYLAVIFAGFAYMFFWIKPYTENISSIFKPFNEPVFAEQTEHFTSKTVTEQLNLRAGPSTDYEVIYILPQNAMVKVFDRGKSEDWVIINYNNIVGYVNQNLLRDITDEVKIYHNLPGLYVGGSFQGKMSLRKAAGWIAQNAQDNENYAIVIGKDEKIPPINLSSNNQNVNITLKATGSERRVQCRVRYSKFQRSAPLFTVGTGITLIIEDGVSLVGLQSGGSQPVINVNGGTFIMNGGIIRDSNNRGVRVENGAFVMNHGTISGHSAAGVIILNESIFTMNGGTINGNSSHGSGGGVFLSSGTFTMNNGTIENNSTGDAGGGVLVNNGDFIMRNGSIIKNYAGSAGGGVRVDNKNGQSAFTMNNGTISGNTASNNNGGGVCVDGTFTMNNGIISDNSTKHYGGGVSLRGTFIMNGGIISGNAASRGGGVNLYTGSNGITFTKSGGIIYGSNAGTGLANRADDNSQGHAVFSDNGRKRNTTAGVNRTMSTGLQGSAGGWE